MRVFASLLNSFGVRVVMNGNAFFPFRIVVGNFYVDSPIRVYYLKLDWFVSYAHCIAFNPSSIALCIIDEYETALVLFAISRICIARTF